MLSLGSDQPQRPEGTLRLGHFCPVQDSSWSNPHQISRGVGGDSSGAVPQLQTLPIQSPVLPLPSRGHVCSMMERLLLSTPDLPSLCLSGARPQFICGTSNPRWNPNDTVDSRSGPRKQQLRWGFDTGSLTAQREGRLLLGAMWGHGWFLTQGKSSIVNNFTADLGKHLKGGDILAFKGCRGGRHTRSVGLPGHYQVALLSCRGTLRT